jgi:hypothetical protein
VWGAGLKTLLLFNRDYGRTRPYNSNLLISTSRHRIYRNNFNNKVWGAGLKNLLLLTGIMAEPAPTIQIG